MQIGARVHALLFDEGVSRLVIDVRGVCLTTIAVERQHQLRAEALTQGMFEQQRFELANQLGVPAEREIRLDALLESNLAQLLEACDFRGHEALVREICKRGAPPERERLPEFVGCVFRPGAASLVKRLPAAGRQHFETGAVELIGGEPQHVSGRLTDQHLIEQPSSVLGFENLPKVRNRHLQGGTCGLRGVLAPDQGDQTLGGHNSIGVDQENCEQGALFGPTQ